MIEEKKKRETCKECGRTTYKGEYHVYCDQCQNEITERYYDQKNRSVIELTIFSEFFKHENNTYQFCNWECGFAWLKEYENREFDFMSLHYVTSNKFEEFLQAWKGGKNK